MAQQNTYDQGNVVRVLATFTQSGSFINPATVNFVALKSDGVTYVRGNNLAPDSLGHYHYDLTVDQGSPSQPWIYRFYSTGVGQASATGSFFVTADALV